jgi:predicted nucleic acid-binding protein
LGIRKAVGILIDASVFLAAARGAASSAALLAGYEAEPVAVSVLTIAQLLQAAHRAASPHQRARRERFVETVLARVPCVEFGPEEARAHARLSAELAARGEVVDPLDALVAATALAHGYRIATVDARPFPRIPGLQILLWDVQAGRR